MDNSAEQTIVVENVKKWFGEGEIKTEVLHGISWVIEPGQMTFLVGPSGCGKTTLISIIAGILSASDGKVTLFGENINAMSNSANARFRRENIGFIFQQFNLLPALTAAENACIPLVANGMAREQAVAAAKAFLAEVGMGEHVNKLPRELSGGQQQRVAIARALIHEPRLLVCDEPTASLDSITGRQVMELLQQNARKPGRCVIVVTHDNRIFEFADVIVTIGDGLIKSINKA
ncbi:ABC transporter ATP-binding protein [Legionella dresdenensis]|uniref:ABC transporter ATP-binding protein n=1 Tax=Legionella dresdenensis TaxID=450200 RepID=A0ABV8CFA4_9GAMM